jgi:hypothetical protein
MAEVLDISAVPLDVLAIYWRVYRPFESGVSSTASLGDAAAAE